MGRYSEISITVGALGIVITLIGLFPGIVGLEAAAGVGVLQVLVILLGFSILFSSAFFFAKKAFYDGQPATLAQEIGIRLTLTGLLIAGAAGLADVLGFGSHPSTPDSRPFLGRLQAIVFTGGIQPQEETMELIRRTDIPVLAVDADTYETASRISDILVKIRISDQEKIELACNLVRRHVDFGQLWDLLA